MISIRDLVPAKTLALNNGVKMIAYGPPGGGKTPLSKTAPNPVMLVTEPGMMTMRDSNIPAYAATNIAQIDGFFEWAIKSAECKKFDTIILDSGSQIAEIVLAEYIAKFRDGRKVFGEMSNKCCEWFDGLYYMQQKHVYIICKQTTEETVSTSMSNGIPTLTTTKKAYPFFPGKDLPMKVSHKFDLVCQVAQGSIPGVAGKVPFIRCHETDDNYARDRSGKLELYEPQNLAALFTKAMS